MATTLTCFGCGESIRDTDRFCSRCGAHLWSRHPTDPSIVSVRMGAFDEDPGVRPSHRQYVAYAAAWEPIPDDGLPRYPEGRPQN